MADTTGTDATVITYDTTTKPVAVAEQQQGQPGTPNIDATGGGEQQPGGEPERRFTQADLERIVRERLAREQQKYADYKDLKAKAEKWAEHEEAQKSELEKAQAAAQRAEAEKVKALADANERLLRAAFLAEAGKTGAQHPEDAYLLADRSQVSIADDGAVVGVAEQVKALVEVGRLPRAGKPQPPNLDGGAGGGERSQDRAVNLTQEEIEMARRLGVSLEEYQKNKNKK